MTSPQESPLQVRDVRAQLSLPPILFIVGNSQEALHRHLFEGREIVEDEQPVDDFAAEMLESQLVQQQRELPIQYWRGVFLDRFFVLDRNLGVVVRTHFDIEGGRVDQWNAWLDGRLSSNQKKELIVELVRARDLSHEFGQLSIRLERMQRFRNVLAHGAMEPMDIEGMAKMLYYQRGRFVSQQFRLLDIACNTWRLHSLNVDVTRIHDRIAGIELSMEPPDLSFITQLEAVRSGKCPDCAAPNATYIHEPASDAWTEPDFSTPPSFVWCPNEEFVRHQELPGSAGS